MLLIKPPDLPATLLDFHLEQKPCLPKDFQIAADGLFAHLRRLRKLLDRHSLSARSEGAEGLEVPQKC